MSALKRFNQLRHPVPRKPLPLWVRVPRELLIIAALAYGYIWLMELEW